MLRQKSLSKNLRPNKSFLFVLGPGNPRDANAPFFQILEGGALLFQPLENKKTAR